MQSRVTLASVLGALAVMACSSQQAAGPPAPPACGGRETVVALTVGTYTSVDPTSDSGCATFAANASSTDTAEYLVVAQAAGGAPGETGPFALRTLALTATASVTRPLTNVTASPPTAAAIFDHFLREVGEGTVQPARPPASFLAPRFNTSGAAGAPPSVGSLRTFTVCATLTCSSFTSVTARARAVGTNVAIYVDTLAPSPGFSTADVDTLLQTFGQQLYPADTNAFGGPTDIDQNGVVIALFTGVVNALVTKAQCTSSGFIVGYFFPADLAPGISQSYNHGEIMYMLAPDSLGTLSCPHTVTSLKLHIGATFMHEFQHMINYGQHVVNRNGPPERVWLDEGLSKYAEELGGRTFLPADPTDFSYYVTDDVYDAGNYLAATGDHSLITSSDQNLPDVGAGWLFVRYLADRFGTGITRKLTETTNIGTANVAAATGEPFPTTVGDWALANWVSDLPGFTAPPELKYTSWAFRSTFAAANQQDPADFPWPFPLAPVPMLSDSVNVSGTLHAGSGTYVRVLQPPGGGPFTLRFDGGGSVPLADSLVPRLAVVRMR